MERRGVLARTAVERIRDICTTDIDLDGLARQLSVSRRQLQRVLAPQGGFRTILTKGRMHAAADLLKTTDLKVGEISKAVGYRQASQFSKAFAREFKERPSKYREKHGASLH